MTEYLSSLQGGGERLHFQWEGDVENEGEGGRKKREEEEMEGRRREKARGREEERGEERRKRRKEERRREETRDKEGKMEEDSPTSDFTAVLPKVCLQCCLLAQSFSLFRFKSLCLQEQLQPHHTSTCLTMSPV